MAGFTPPSLVSKTLSNFIAANVLAGLVEAVACSAIYLAAFASSSEEAKMVSDIVNLEEFESRSSQLLTAHQERFSEHLTTCKKDH